MQKQNNRREQRWVSHNKVLIGSGDGGGKKPHARNPNFDSGETRLLIHLWGDPNIQRTLITIHKKHPVIASIAEKMREYGYNRSTEEINTRIKNLKCLYNRIKKDLDSGLLNEPSWKHYHAMDEILTRPIFGNNVSVNNAAASLNKIIISPETIKACDQSQSLLQVKEEEISEEENNDDEDDDEDENNGMEFAGNQLRPEDLLSVVNVEEENNEIQIKEEPMDVSTLVETKQIEKSDSNAEILPKKEQLNTTSNDNVKDVVKYQNDSPLSISAIRGNYQPQSSSSSIIQISPNNFSSAPSTVTSKISLVPTKLLLKSQTGFTPTSSATTISTSDQSSIPMKVVLVNTLNNSNANAQQATVTTVNKQQITLNKTLAQQLQNSTPNSTFNLTNKIISQTQPTKVHLVNQVPSPNFNVTPSITNVTPSPSKPSAATNKATSSNGHHNHHSKRHESSSSSSSSSSSRKGGKSSKSLFGSNKIPVLRNLLNSIIETEKQRLEIEKQRFEYEKCVGNELLSLLKTFMSTSSSSSNTRSKSGDGQTSNGV